MIQEELKNMKSSRLTQDLVLKQDTAEIKTYIFNMQLRT